MPPSAGRSRGRLQHSPVLGTAGGSEPCSVSSSLSSTAPSAPATTSCPGWPWRSPRCPAAWRPRQPSSCSPSRCGSCCCPPGTTRSRARLARQVMALRQRHARQPHRLQRELTELYRREGTGMFAGYLPLLLQLPFFAVMYRLFRLGSIGGQPNALLSHGVLGAPLGSHWLSGPGPLSGQGMVYLGLFALLAVVTWMATRISRNAAARQAEQAPAPARPARPARPGQPAQPATAQPATAQPATAQPATAQPGGAVGMLLRMI